MKFIFVILLWFSSSRWQIVTSLEEIGDSCTTTTGEKGICKIQTECVESENISPNTEFAETCKLHPDGTPIICCILKSSTTKRDYVSTRNDFHENEFYESNTINETETRFYNGPRKKTMTYTKNPYNKGETDNLKKTQINTKFYDYDSYGNTFANPNIISQPNYFEYDNPRPSYGLTNFVYNHSPDTVVFKPSSYSTTNGGNSPIQNTRPNNNNVNSGSNNNYNPIQSTRPSNNNNFGSSGFSSDRGNSNQSIRPSNNFNIGSTSGSGLNQNTRPNTASNSFNSNGNTGTNGYHTNQNTRPIGNNYHQNTRPNTGSSSLHGFTTGQNIRPSSTNIGGGGNNLNQNTRPTGSSSNFNTNNWSNNGNGGNNYRPTTTSNEGPIWGSTSRVTSNPITGLSNNNGWTSGSQQQKRISEQKCSEYAGIVTSTISAIPLSINAQATSHQVQECPFQATGLIVGGTKVNLGEYPHMAALGFRSGNSIVYNCGGSLISEDYVLTAAHCTHSSYGHPVHVRLGDLNLARDDDTQPQIINVASVIVHPNYKAPQLYNDIALIRLARRVPFSRNLRPACLHTKREINAEKATATGWGSTNYGEISSDDLLKVVLDIIDNNQCNTLYGSDNKLRNGITETMMCAGVLAGKKDTCQGDSGGPLQIHDPNNKCLHYVIGITSFGKSCGAINSPGIYTRVSEFVPWIESIVWKNQRF